MDDVVDFYEHASEPLTEAARLFMGLGQIEFARTQEIILRHLAPPPLDILDVGGAAGVYSGWLGSLGYKTHLIDATPRHVAEARQDSRIASAEVGDARAVKHPAASFDAVLLMGPLYHLTEHADRLLALREARRVLRPGGLLVAAAISRFASLLDALDRGFIDDPRFVAILEQDLATGQHRNTTGVADYFTTAFFHHPNELAAEVTEAGFAPPELLAVEGPAWAARDFDARWQDPARRQQLLDLVRAIEHEPSLLGMSPHLLAVARKP